MPSPTFPTLPRRLYPVLGLIGLASFAVPAAAQAPPAVCAALASHVGGRRGSPPHIAALDEPLHMRCVCNDMTRLREQFVQRDCRRQIDAWLMDMQ